MSGPRSCRPREGHGRDEQHGLSASAGRSPRELPLAARPSPVPGFRGHRGPADIRNRCVAGGQRAQDDFAASRQRHGDRDQVDLGIPEQIRRVPVGLLTPKALAAALPYPGLCWRRPRAPGGQQGCGLSCPTAIGVDADDPDPQGLCHGHVPFVQTREQASARVARGVRRTWPDRSLKTAAAVPRKAGGFFGVVFSCHL